MRVGPSRPHDGRRGSPGHRHAERSIHAAESLGVDQRAFDDDQCEQAQRDRAREQPGRGLWRSRFVRVGDQARQAGAGSGDRQRDRKVAQHPVGEGPSIGPWQAPPDHVEVDVPEAEAENERKDARHDRRRVVLRDGQPIDDAEDDLAKNDDGEQPEPLDQGVGRRHSRAEAHGRTAGEDDPDDPGADDNCPHDESGITGEECARDDRGGRDHHARSIAAGHLHEFVRVLAPDLVPLPGHEGQERRVHQRERGTGLRRGIGREHGQPRQDGHLDEHHTPGPAVIAAVELDIERAVDPGDPDHGEDDGELADPAGGDVLGEVMGGLPA